MQLTKSQDLNIKAWNTGAWTLSQDRYHFSALNLSLGFQLKATEMCPVASGLLVTELRGAGHTQEAKDGLLPSSSAITIFRDRSCFLYLSYLAPINEQSITCFPVIYFLPLIVLEKLECLEVHLWRGKTWLLWDLGSSGIITLIFPSKLSFLHQLCLRLFEVRYS